MEALLHDYGVLVAPVAAILNGLIAVLIAQFFRDRLFAKIFLVVFAGILGAAAIAATIYNQHEAVAAQKAEVQHRKEVQEQLGRFIAEGLTLIANCDDNSKPPPWPQTNAWMARIEKFLDEKMGHSYVDRLSSPSGIPVNVACRNADGAHNDHYHVVYAVNFRLDEYSHEPLN
jgi:hypothetical protein